MSSAHLEGNVDSNRESLVQYATPIELSKQSGMQQQKQPSLSFGKKRAILPPLESKPDMESILNAILPPREWTYEMRHFIQYVSHASASREDVADLQKRLDDRLVSRQARESGICRVREELHSQCFDEIIRQVTIDCPERGLLLMRVRDELKMTIAAYQTLYKSAVAFGTKKQIEALEGKDALNATIKELEDTRKALDDRRIELENKKKAILNWIEEKNAHDIKRRSEDKEYIGQQNANLEAFFAGLEANK